MGFTSSAITVDSEGRGLSGGEKQGVAIGRALYFNADLIILDEPTVGLSLHETQRVLDFVKGIRRRGKSAIFIDHNIFHVYDVVDRFVILDRSEEHTSELQSLMRTSSAVYCLQKQNISYSHMKHNQLRQQH